MRFTPLAGTAAGNDFVAVLLSPVTAVAVALGAISTGRGWWCAMRKALRPPRAARQRTA